MSDNPRLQKWLEQMDEGQRINPSNKNSAPLPHQTIIRQEIVYIPQSNVYVGFWRRVFAVVIDSLILGFMSIIVQLATSNVIIPWLVSLFYFTYWPCTHFQGTFGKLAIGAKIVDVNGNQISYLNSVGRFLSLILSGVLFMIGYFMVAFHAEKRGLHDLMAGTRVVNR